MRILLVLICIGFLTSCADSNNSGNPFAFFGSPLIGMWVDENTYNCLFPTEQNYLCAENELRPMGTQLKQFSTSDSYFAIDNGPQLSHFYEKKLIPKENLDYEGFTPESSGWSWMHLSAGIIKHRFISLDGGNRVQRETFFRKNKEEEFTIIETKFFVRFEDSQLHAIDHFLNVFFSPDVDSSEVQRLKDEIAHRQSVVLTKIIPQNQSPIQKAKWIAQTFKLTFSQSVVDALNEQDSLFKGVSFFNGKLFPVPTYMFAAPKCTITSKISAWPLQANEEYIITEYFSDDPSGSIVFNFGPKDSFSFPFTFHCEREYDSREITIADVEHAIGAMALFTEVVHN